MANRRYIDFPIASTSGDTDIILIWQDGANKQTTKATFLSGLPENLEDLNDVVISGLTNGQILRYDSVTGKWENTDQGNLDLNDLNDVSIVSPSNGQVLVYNSSTSKWENSSGGFVPYVGAVTTVDLGAQGLRAGYVRFDTTVAGVPNEQGLMFWDADDETVDIILNGYTMKIGEDLFYPVKNQTGSTIAKGVAVRFNGTVGASGRLLIAPFIADGSVPSSRFMGVTAEEILNGEDGKVLYFGRIRGINTNAFNEGDILYASTTVAGGYQTAIPVAPNNIVQVAAVVTKSATVGTIFVRPTLGSNINKDEGVKIVSVADKNLLQYQSGTSLWENKSLAQVLGGTSAQFVKGDGSLDSSTYGTGTVTSVGLSSATSGVTIGSSPVTTSGTITLTIATASGSQNGLLSSTDWTTFNNKQNALTNPVTGTGTTNYLPKFTGSTTIGNSQIFDNGSNVGIGNVIPGSFFSAARNLVVGTGSGNNGMSIYSGSAAVGDIAFADGTTDPAFYSGLIRYDHSLDAMRFFTASTERMRITSSGNLGLGVTPSAWASDFRALQIRLGTSLYNNGNTNGTFLGSNFFFNGSNNIYIGTGTATAYAQSLGTHAWYYAPSGTAGNAISFTQAMTLTSGGNLLVGTTTDNGARLQVSGTATISGNTTITGNLTLNGAVTRNINFYNDTNSSLNAQIQYDQISSNSGQLFFGTNNAGTFSTKLTIANTGAATFSSSVTAGGALLVSYANARASINSTTITNSAYMSFGNTTTGYVGLDNSAGTDFGNGAYSLNLINGGAYNLNLGTSNVTRLAITSGGNVLIGTTTSGASKLRIVGLPTSSSGLLSGDVWNDGGTLKIA